jgi:membrane fusion protein, heavy metal efflux system
MAAPPVSDSASSAVNVARTVQLASEEALKAAGVQTQSAILSSVTEQLRVPGVVTYDERYVAQLSTRVPGTVWQVERHQGDTVRRGEVLIVVESEEVGRLKAEFLQALVAMESRSEALAALEQVLEAIPGRQYREAKSALRDAQIRLMNTEQALVNLGFSVRVADYLALPDAERAQRMRVLDLPESIVAQREVSTLTSNLLPLVAPYDGVVIGRDVTVGEVVTPGQPVFELADIRRLWVELSLQRLAAQRVELGQPVQFLVDGSDQTIETKISWISTEVDERTRTLTARAEVDHRALLSQVAGRPWHANTFGTGVITVRELPEAKMVPLESVQRLGREDVVFVQTSPLTFEARPVQTGPEQDGWLVITGDVPLGTPVVTAGSHVLKSELVFSRVATADKSARE